MPVAVEFIPRLIQESASVAERRLKQVPQSLLPKAGHVLRVRAASNLFVPRIQIPALPLQAATLGHPHQHTTALYRACLNPPFTHSIIPQPPFSLATLS